MNIFIGILVGLFSLLFLITAHEFGHFLMARKNGVKVLEFGIGLPPRAIAWIKDSKTGKWRRLPKSDWEKSQKSLIFSLNWLPIGGFCQMDGESAADSRPHTFGAASFWSKTKILFGGVTMNWLISIIIFTILAWTGMPTLLPNQFTVKEDTRSEYAGTLISNIITGYPAEAAGLRTGDIILSVDGQEVREGIIDYNSAHAGETVVYQIKRYDTTCKTTENCRFDLLDVPVTLNSTDQDYLLGAALSFLPGSYSYSTWSAPLVGIGLTAQLTGETFKGVGDLIWNLLSGIAEQFSFNDETREQGRAAISAAGDAVSGPVGIIGVLFPTFTSTGFANTAFLVAIISLSLACMNVLPIPALDGGRWLLIAIYKLLKKPLSKETENRIVSRAMIALLALAVVITILDIVRLF